MSGVYRIELPTPFDVGTVNCYVIRADELVLVDAGPHDDRVLAALQAGLQRIGCRLEDIGLVLLTHQHVDHIGLAGEIARRSNAQIAAHRLLGRATHHRAMVAEKEAAYADRVMRLHNVDNAIRGELAELWRKNARYVGPLSVDVPLQEGDQILLARDCVLEVALRPGHSPTDTLFVAADRALAFVGDHLLGNVSSNPMMHRPLDGDEDERPSASLARYLESLRLTALDDIDVLHPGHGGLIRNHRRLIATRLRESAVRTAAVAAAIERGVTTGAGLIEALWPGLPAGQFYLALSEILGHVDLLLSAGEIRELNVEGHVEFVSTA